MGCQGRLVYNSYCCCTKVSKRCIVGNCNILDVLGLMGISIDHDGLIIKLLDVTKCDVIAVESNLAEYRCQILCCGRGVNSLRVLINDCVFGGIFTDLCPPEYSWQLLYR